MTLKLCTICGEPCTDGRCPAHRPEQPTKTSSRQRGYTTTWDKLSARARKMQPWCTDCGTKQDLTADHLRWPATKLEHVDVVCRPCNSRRGAARSLTDEGTRGTTTPSGPPGEGRFAHSAGRGSR